MKNRKEIRFKVNKFLDLDIFDSKKKLFIRAKIFFNIRRASDKLSFETLLKSVENFLKFDLRYHRGSAVDKNAI